MNANTKKSIGTFFYKYWLLLFTALVLLGFGALAPATLGFTNLLNIASNACLTAIAGIGATCTMCTGDFDLSTGSILTMGCFLMVLFVKDCHMNYFMAIFLTLVCCALLGLMNALIHVKEGPNINFKKNYLHLFQHQHLHAWKTVLMILAIIMYILFIVMIQMYV